MSNDTSNNPDGDLDRAIDRAVSGMVQVEPRAGLRRRVLTRIAGPSPRAMFLPRFAFAAAALAAVLMILVVRRDPPTPATVSVAQPAAPPVAASASGTSAGVDANKTSADEAAVRPEAPLRNAPVVAGRRGSTTEPIRMPPVANVFGPRDNRAAATNVLAPRDATGPVPEPPARAPIEIPALGLDAQPVPRAALEPAPARGRPNISIELTISDQAGTNEPIRKVVTMIVADRQSGSVRSSGIVTTAPGGSGEVAPAAQRGGGALHVDASPSIQPDGTILVSLALEYAAPSDTGARGRSPLKERMGVVLESGKGLVISQAADAGSNRRVIVELKATILHQRP